MNIRPLKTAIDNLAAHHAESVKNFNDMERYRNQFGCDQQFPEAYHCTDFERVNDAHATDARAGRRRVRLLIAGLVCIGMLTAAFVHADPIGRLVDTLHNPHIEGFK